MDPREATGPGRAPAERRRSERRQDERRQSDRRGGDRTSSGDSAPGSADRLRQLLDAERRKVRTLTARADLLERQRDQLLARARAESPPARPPT